LDFFRQERREGNLFVFLSHLLPLSTEYSSNFGEGDVGIVSRDIGMLVLAEEHVRAQGSLGPPPSLLALQLPGGPLGRGCSFAAARGRGFGTPGPPSSH